MRQKVTKFQKIIIKDKLSTFNFIFLIVSVLVIKELNLLFYNTLDSPDFNKYIVYLQHFFDGQITNKEHGLMYYYVHSLNYSIFYSDLNNHSEEAPDNANTAKMYFPICGFETWNGHTGSCNVCCQAQFQIEINYYKLRAHTMNPNSSYIAETTEFAAGYFDVFPFTPSSTPKVLLGQNLSTVPEVVDVEGDLGEMNFQNSKTSQTS